jgi:hypothetical protein
MRQEATPGFQTGGLFKAVVTDGKTNEGRIGRVAIRATGLYGIKTSQGITMTSYKKRHRLQNGDVHECSIRPASR